MSVLIKGMKMPQNCFNCSTKIDPENRRCDIDRHIFEETLGKLTTRRDDNCPLVEVPTPHGPLIDADKLLKKGINLSWSVQKWVSEVDIGLMRTIIEVEEGEA